MNIRRFIITGFSVFIAFCVMDILVHGVMLSSTYSALSNVWRPDMNSLMWMMYLASLLFSFVFAWLFSRGYKGHGIKEGLVFGFIMGIGINIMASIGQYTMYPLPGIMCIKWFFFGTAEYIIAGIVASLTYRE